MKKVLIIYSSEGNLKEIAEGIAEGARKNAYQVDLISTREQGKVVSFFPYDVVLVGSPAYGVIKGKIAPDIPPFLSQCKRTAGKEAIAFVSPKGMATDKALKVLMAELEKLGCFVNNFTALKSRQSAVAFGEQL
ncbi:MAG: flavodoxin family protein [Halanaerobiaceae bacterium]|nr:flavodoxin family protein [Halanaerobiaceae bacterium]